MQSALPKRQWRLDEVRVIDPQQATGTYTPEFASITDAILVALGYGSGTDIASTPF